MASNEEPASAPSLEEAFATPARALEGAAEAAEQGERAVMSKVPFKLAEEYWDTLGPGLTTGAADNDPSGIVTYSQAGARYGFQLLWMPLFTFPFMAVVQEMCARIGVASGRGLAANIRRHHSAGALYTVTALLFFANALNIAADLGAMAAATRLLVPGLAFELLVVLFAGASLLLQVFTTYARYAKYLKYLTLTLFSYVAVALAVHLDWGAALTHTLVPSLTFSRNQLFLVAAVLGTTISPYLFFWQTSQEVEEEELAGETTLSARRAGASRHAVRKMRVDVWSGMFFSNLVAFFIFVTCAGTLYAHGITNIETAGEAALALRPFGEFAYLFFAAGIIGTGLLAVPVLAASSAYAFAESFGWKAGLYRKLKQAYAFYGVIIVSMLLGIIANLLHLDPIKGLLWAAVGNGLIAPVILFFVVRLSANRAVMGEHANRPLTSLIGWATVALMTLSGFAAIVSLL
ncbi:MAG TPA: divalent metal cation transporter [Candidatus Paceibacterota bacterium]|nr:divalent metal cation transporter [Candidatus Paceibacterota bacterium]